jgi:hypothetical protein
MALTRAGAERPNGASSTASNGTSVGRVSGALGDANVLVNRKAPVAPKVRVLQGALPFLGPRAQHGGVRGAGTE